MQQRENVTSDVGHVYWRKQETPLRGVVSRAPTFLRVLGVRRTYKSTFPPVAGVVPPYFVSPPFYTRHGAIVGRESATMYQIGNIYGITAIAVIGGGLFGFDISSMSAMYVSRILLPDGSD